MQTAECPAPGCGGVHGRSPASGSSTAARHVGAGALTMQAVADVLGVDPQGAQLPRRPPRRTTRAGSGRRVRGPNSAALLYPTEGLARRYPQPMPRALRDATSDIRSAGHLLPVARRPASGALEPDRAGAPENWSSTPGSPVDGPGHVPADGHRGRPCCRSRSGIPVPSVGGPPRLRKWRRR